MEPDYLYFQDSGEVLLERPTCPGLITVEPESAFGDQKVDVVVSNGWLKEPIRMFVYNNFCPENPTSHSYIQFNICCLHIIMNLAEASSSS